MKRTALLVLPALVLATHALAQDAQPATSAPATEAAAPAAEAAAQAPATMPETAAPAQGEVPGYDPRLDLPGIQKLTITGQYRLRYENRNNFLFSAPDGTPINDVETYDFFGQRVRLNFGLELNDQISAFVQVQDVRFWGEEEGGTVARQSPGLDFHQAYVEVEDFPGIGGTDRLGRQILSYGNERLIGALEWLNRGRAFDGIRHRWSGESFSSDLFVTQISENLAMVPQGFPQDSYFIGSYNTFDIYEDGLLDAYLLYSNLGEQNTTRWTVGARWDHGSDAIDAELELATQFGETGGADIPIFDTYALAANVTIKLGGDIKPYIKLGFDAASGNDPNSTDNERFNNLFPTAHKHWGMMDYALWSNLMAPSVEIGIKPGKNSKLALSWWNLNSDQAGDVFGGPGGVLVPAGSATSTSIGNEIDLFYNWNIPAERVKLGLQAGLAAFLPGEAVKEARGGSNDDTTYFAYLQGDFRF